MSKLLRSAKDVLNGNSLMRSSAFVNGSWIKCKQSFPVYSPATNEVITEVSDAGAEEVGFAIHAASNAFQVWRNTPARDRSSLLHNLYINLMESKEAMSNIITAESGKSIKDSRAEVDYGASFFQWFAEEAKRIDGDTIAGADPHYKRFVFKQPIGVVALISPWNFPLAMITRKLGAAMAVGCASVIKPSEETPLTALALAAIAEKSGIPAGVLNVLPCSREMAPTVGDIICEDSVVRKISFTGSTSTGKLLFKKSADTVKRLSLELGGSAPFVVFNSADMQLVIDNAISAKFRVNGQTCIAPDRFLVQEDIHEQFIAELKRAVENVKVGDPFEEDTHVGALINKAGIQKVESHVLDAIEKGGEPVIGCKRHSLGENYFKPSIIDHCNSKMRCMMEETFGPLIPVMKFDTEEEAISLANTSQCGLAGYIFSKDVAQIFRVSEKLEVGMLGVNTAVLSSEFTPFGGIKESGLGREGSKYGIEEYLEMKYVCLGGL